MILLLNVRITEPFDNVSISKRGYYHRDDQLDVLKYTISSLAAVNKWTKAIFRVRLDEQYKPRWEELKEHIYNEFAPVCNNIEITDWRNEYQYQWREEVERLEAEPDPLVWYTCNHDHVFIDYDLEALSAALTAFDKDPAECKSIFYSYFPEANRKMKYAFPEDFEMLPCGTIRARWDSMESVQIVSKPLLRHWWCSGDYGDTYLPRSDWYNVYKTEPYRVFLPFREVCKHFDGYAYAFRNDKVMSPLTIPPGFFEKQIRVAYGFDDSIEGWVNINPLRPYKTETPDGVDYKCMYEDLPLFWKDRIVEAGRPLLIRKQILSARNQAVRDYLTAPAAHPILGDSLPSEQYIQKSMRVSNET